MVTPMNIKATSDEPPGVLCGSFYKYVTFFLSLSLYLSLSLCLSVSLSLSLSLSISVSLSLCLSVSVSLCLSLSLSSNLIISRDIKGNSDGPAYVNEIYCIHEPHMSLNDAITQCKNLALSLWLLTKQSLAPFPLIN